MAEDKAHEHEIDRNCDAEDQKRSHFIANAKRDERVEQHNMQQIVDKMCTAESHAALCREPFPEGEACREIVVEHQAEQIAGSIGNVHIHPVLQHPVDTVVERCGYRAHNAKAKNFAKCLPVNHRLQR